MANIWEVNPTDISVNDPTIAKALTNVDANNKPVLQPMWQFEQALKQDDRYFKTNQAHQDMTGLAAQIARDFGKA